MDAKNARILTRYNAWANRLMFEAMAKLPDGEATKPRASLFRNMVHTLNHNYVIDRIWQGHLQGRDHGYTARNTDDHPPLDELWRLQQEVDAWYHYLHEQGIAFEKKPMFNPNYNIYHCFIRDPNGYLIEIQQFLDPAWPVPTK